MTDDQPKDNILPFPGNRRDNKPPEKKPAQEPPQHPGSRQAAQSDETDHLFSRNDKRALEALSRLTKFDLAATFELRPNEEDHQVVLVQHKLDSGEKILGTIDLTKRPNHVIRRQGGADVKEAVIIIGNILEGEDIVVAGSLDKLRRLAKELNEISMDILVPGFEISTDMIEKAAAGDKWIACQIALRMEELFDGLTSEDLTATYSLRPDDENPDYAVMVCHLPSGESADFCRVSLKDHKGRAILKLSADDLPEDSKEPALLIFNPAPESSEDVLLIAAYATLRNLREDLSKMAFSKSQPVKPANDGYTGPGGPSGPTLGGGKKS